MNGPEIWDKIYDKVPASIIAGGCVRDYLLGLEPKDIDVFIPYVNEGVYQATVTALQGQGFDPDPNANEVDNQYDDFRLYNALFEGSKVQFIFRNDIRIDPAWRHDGAQNLLKTFDVGLVRFYYTRTQIYGTRQAHEDLENNTCTLMTASWHKSYDRYITWRRRNIGNGANFEWRNPNNYAG